MTIPVGFSHAKSALEDEALYAEYVVPERFKKPERRFRWLFSDVFGHHIQIDSTDRTATELSLNRTDKKRIVEQDDVSSIFRERFLDGFRVSETSNEAKQDIQNNLLENWTEIYEIIDPAVVFPYSSKKGFGNNRLSLLLGDAGYGKSLILSKVLSACRPGVRPDGGIPVAVYVNMESAWSKEDGAFKPIDNSFWDLLLQRLIANCTSLDGTIKLRDEVTKIMSDSLIDSEERLKRVCREMPTHGFYAVIAIDNIDRFHFAETRQSFFQEYRSDQTLSIEKNICHIVSKFNDYDALGRISASVILVCRKPVHDHLIIAADGSDPNDNRLKGYTVFQVLEPSTQQIITPRLRTLSDLIQSIAKKADGEFTREEVDSFTSAVKILTAATSVKGEGHASNDGLRGDICDLLLNLSHQGPRGVIQFLSEFELDCRKNGEAIERVFSHQPRNILRLYISNRRKRYSQATQHFPNIFLNDCLVDPDPRFPNAHKPHRQTYWLKWLVLKLIEMSPGGKIACGDLFKLLISDANYEDHFVRLVVGSLATPNKFGCIAVRYKNHSIESRILSLTRRGRALVSDATFRASMGVPFCFGFDYLQLVSDDPWMTYPTAWADRIVPPKISLDYSLREHDQYHAGSSGYLKEKMPSTLVFLRTLEASWVRESLRLGKMSTAMRSGVTPDFDRIANGLLDAYGAIQSYWGEAGREFAKELREQWKVIKADHSFNDFWEGPE